MEAKNSLVLIAGLSGAGRSSVQHFLSDLGYHTIDNLPVALFDELLTLMKKQPEKYKRAALHVDIMSSSDQKAFLDLFASCKKQGLPVYLLFLDCNVETILRRYHETRRPHPGFDPQRDQTLEDTIRRERSRFQPIKEIANLRLDTSNLSIHDLKRQLKSFVDSLSNSSSSTMRINFLTFGFKYGLPLHCDLIADVRFLPNPYFVDHLKDLNGLQDEVYNYVLANQLAQAFIQKYSDLLNFLIPNYVHEGKSYLNIGIGCTGGKHRSVSIARKLQELIPAGNYITSVEHRDLNK